MIVDARYADMVGSAGKLVMDSDDFLAAARGHEPVAEFADPDSVGVVLFTSGTTSQPKAVELTHNNLTSYITSTVEYGAAEEADAALICVPPYHIAGVSAALSNLYAGRKMVYLPNFDAEEWVRLIRDEAVTTATVVPTMLDRIVKILESGEHQLVSLRNLAYGGSKVGLPLVRKAITLLPHVGFVNAYGLTETSSTIAVLTPMTTVPRTATPTRLPPGGSARSANRCPASRQIRDDAGNVLGPGKPANCSSAASRCPVSTPASVRCSTTRAGFPPRTSPCSTTRATCSSADALTTRSSAAARTSRLPRSRTCSSSTPTCTKSRSSASKTPMGTGHRGGRGAGRRSPPGPRRSPRPCAKELARFTYS